MTHVLVIEVGRIAPFARRAERGTVVVANDVDAVRVLRRHQHDDGVGENRSRLAVLCAGEAIGEHDGRGESAHLGGVNRRRHENDVPALVEQRLSLAGSLEPRVHELALDLPVMLEIRQVRRIGDERDDERPAQGCLAERAHLHPGARLAERGEVLDDLLPTREVAIGAGFEAQDRRRGGDRALRVGAPGGSRQSRGGHDKRG